MVFVLVFLFKGCEDNGIVNFNLIGKSMANVEMIYPLTLKLEGGYQADPVDTGNYNARKELIGCKFGITPIVLEAFLKKPVTVEMMKALDEDTAKKVMKVMFWDPIKGDRIKNQSIAMQIFDWFWGSGFTGIKETQEAINNALGNKLKVDFQLENWEVDLINSDPDQAGLHQLIKEERINFLNSIINRSVENYKIACRQKGVVPTDKEILRNTKLKYKKGWLLRANSFVFVEN